MLVDGVEVSPFPEHPKTFRRRGEYLSWFMAMFPAAPEIAYVMAAGSEELFVQELKVLRG